MMLYVVVISTFCTSVLSLTVYAIGLIW